MQESKNKPDIQTQASHESQSDQHNNATEVPVPDTGSASISSNDNRKVSREDIELVQNLIERCLQLYMNKDEVVKTLLNRGRINPGFTTLDILLDSPEQDDIVEDFFADSVPGPLCSNSDEERP